MVSFLDPGRMRTEMVIERPELTADAAGGHGETWIEAAVVMAHLEPVAAKQRFAADQTLEAVTHRITMRHRAGVASGHRLRKGSRVFHITTLHDPDETGRYLVAMTREVGL